MTEAAAKDVEVKVGKDLTTATINGTKVEISPEGNVVVFTNAGVQTKPAAAVDAAAKKEGTSIDIGKDFNTVAMYGATVELAADGSLIVSTNGKVQIKPAAANAAAPANDTSVLALMAGTKMADGSVFAGLTADGKQQIYAMPTDLSVTLTFNDAAKAVKKLNADKALGHDDWQIPALENVRVLQKNQNEGALKGTFNTSNKGSSSVFPGWYWSFTEYRDGPSCVRGVRFSDGGELWNHKDYDRFSCRPVRLVATSSAPAPG